LTLTAADSLEIMQLVTRVATEPPHTLHLTLNVTIEESVPNLKCQQRDAHDHA